MLRALELKTSLLNYTIQSSSTVATAYLDMAHIGQCSLRLYTLLTQGQEPTTAARLASYQNQLLQADLLHRLRLLNPTLTPGQTYSAHSGRLQGCSAAVLDGCLITLKPVSQADLFPIVHHRRLPYLHYNHLQCLLHYSGCPQAAIIYLAGDTGEMYVSTHLRDHRIGESIHLKAATLFEHVDYRLPPDCDCGLCLPITAY